MLLAIYIWWPKLIAAPPYIFTPYQQVLVGCQGSMALVFLHALFDNLLGSSLRLTLLWTILTLCHYLYFK